MKYFFSLLVTLLLTYASQAQSTLTYTGAIAATDPVIPNRIFRDGVTSACGVTKAYPGIFSGSSVNYDTYTFRANSATCVTVTLSPTCAESTILFASAYSGSFNPNDLSQNYRGDLGSSPIGNSPSASMSFNVLANEAVVLVVNNVNSGETCSAYTLTASAPAPAVLADGAAPAVTVSVQYQTGDLGQPTDNQLRPFLQLVNTGATAVPYSSLTVRYWLTPENFMGQLVTPIDYAKLGTGFVSARYVQLATPRQGAFGYIEYSFAAGAGNLAAGTNSGPIYGKAYKPDYTNFDETDDWSYQTSSSFTENSHVTLYLNGTLVNGTEPPAVAATTALNVFSASRDAAASTQFVSVQLQVRNTGNTPVNYSDVKARYYFTRDGATAIVPQVDYAKLGASNITLRVVSLATPVTGADAYLEIGFSATLGVFYPRTSTDDILVKLRKDNYQALDQTNDYSFTGSTSLLVNNRFPAYLNGALVFGTPPAGAPAIVAPASQETAATSQEAAARAGADETAALTRGPLELRLTASPNPVTDQVRLSFALPYIQAYTLAVYDGQGRLVQQVASGEAAAGQTQEVAVPTQTYAAGLYLVRLTTATDVQTFKFVKH